MPNVDLFTMFWMVVGAILLTVQAIFDFTLFDFMPIVVASVFMSWSEYLQFGRCRGKDN